MDIALPRYRPSGLTRMAIIPTTLVAGAVAAIAGIIYAVVLSFIPFIYVDIFLVFGLGFGVGAIVRAACYYAHCRNRAIGLALGIALGAVALGASYWMDYTLDRSSALGKAPPALREELTTRFTFSRWIEARREAGWVVKGSTINGNIVTIVWCFEALFVFAFTCTMGWQAGNEPYCEQCMAWPKDHNVSLRGRDASDFWGATQGGTSLDLAQLASRQSDRTDVSLALTGLVCERCGNGFLNVDEETITVKDGNERIVRKPVVRGLVLEQRNCEYFVPKEVAVV